MAPRTFKGKTPVNQIPTAAAASAAAATSAGVPSSLTAFTGDFFDLYNDLISAKTELLESAPGSARKRAMEELGKAIVSLFFLPN
jgi:hypothetical protein